MSIPLPPVELEGHCSTIVDNTLYVLSPTAFQSLPLQKHAQWAEETAGVGVTGPACVTIFPNGTDSQAQLWVIGGTSSNSSYEGVQVYSFANKSWQSIDSPVPVMQGRVNHTAAYLQDSQSIVVYAGAQQNAPTVLSSETFVIPTQPPYTIQAYTSNAPTANMPILQPWDTGSVVMVGGSVLNTQISLFSPQGGWQFLSATLETPLNPGARGILVDGSDGSKVLEVYDANVSPNYVAQVVLLGAGGAAAYTGEKVGNGTASRKRQQGLTLSNWPAYNSQNAPSAIRTDFSVAQGSSGLAVLAGGNSQQPVAIFNQDQNSWVDASKFFDSHTQQPLKPSTTSSLHSTKPTSLPTATSSPSTTSTAAPSGSGLSQHDRTLRLLGIILGVLCGIAVIFIIILLLLRWRRQKKRRAEGWVDEKNDQHMSFQDRGTSFMKETGEGAAGVANAPWRQSRNGSRNSLVDRFNKRLSNKRTPSGHMPKSSFDSTSNLVDNRQASDAVELADIEKPPLARKMTPRMERSDRPPTVQYGPNLTPEDARDTPTRANRNRSSGWSKYFATTVPSGPNGLSHIPSAYKKNAANVTPIKQHPPSDGSTYSVDRIASQHSRIPSSTLAPALVDFSKSIDGNPVSHVNMGSPSFSNSHDDFAQRGSRTDGQEGLIVDPGRRRDSQSESVSSYNQSALSSARTSEYLSESGAMPWNPTDPSTFKDHVNSRPPSNVLDDAERRVPSRSGADFPFWHGSGNNSYRPPRSSRSTTTKDGFLAAPNTPAAAPPAPVAGASDDADRHITVWPKYIPSADYSKPAEQAAAAAQAEAEELVGARSAWPVPPTSANRPALAPAPLQPRANVSVFPNVAAQPGSYARGHQPQLSQSQKPTPNSDLGWLNLGLGNGSQNRL
ncbi:hypothetical protein BDY17DRAFT_308197 [Neohortaea acidophila]|uniref:Uncharacterized protein n=1 Tax=Neohortaea acidophila TaxID=245834 RepID=A0A6A6Q5A9_9PEZI|nr:uncharacterized protein BDY17DRAFT_308197 [Neohortaea acidophila]KAF2486823.1 hypothetical protein BDY17DRAFT_308197 [Neohortaea acidophila]